MHRDSAVQHLIRPRPIARNLSNSATRGVKVSGSRMSELRSDADIEPNSASESMTARSLLKLARASRPSTGPSQVRLPDWLRTQWPRTMHFGADRCRSLRNFLVPRADFA